VVRSRARARSRLGGGGGLHDPPGAASKARLPPLGGSGPMRFRPPALGLYALFFYYFFHFLACLIACVFAPADVLDDVLHMDDIYTPHEGW